MDSLSMVIGNLKAMAGGMPDASSAMGDVQAQGASFGDILGGFMSAGKADAAEEIIPDVQPEVKEEAEETLLSPQAENALKNLIAGYFKSVSGDDVSEEDIVSKLTEMMKKLDGGTFSELAAFSAEIQTSLFGDGSDGEKSPKDVLSELFEKYLPEKEEEKTEETDNIILGAYASAYAALAAAVVEAPAAETAVTENNVGAVEAAAETEITAAQAKDMIASADDSSAEMFVQTFSQAVEAVQSEKTADGETEQNENSPENGEQHQDMQAVIEKPENTAEAHPAKELAERFSYARPVISEKSEADIPRIKLDSDDDVSADMVSAMTRNTAAENTADIPEAEVPVFSSEEEAAENVNFQTAEQILDRITQTSNGDTHEIIVRLNPRSLGQIAVKITKSAEGAVDISMAAQSGDVARLLDVHKGELAQLLVDKGSEVNTVNVVNPSEAGHYLGFEMNGGQNPFLFGGGAQSRHGSGVVGSSEEEDTDDGIEAVSAEKIYISQEARLWTTA